VFLNSCKASKHFWTILSAGALLLSSCAKPAATTTGAAKLKAIEIGVASAESRDVARSIRANGTLVSLDSADITPQVSERIVSIPVKVGQHVEKGEVLLQLETANLELRLKQAQAAEQQSRSSVLQAESRLGLTDATAFDVNKVPEVISARVNADTAKSQAELAAANARRYGEVFKTGDISQSQYDQSVHQAQSAADQVRMAEQQYQSAMNTARQSFQMVVGARASNASSQVQVALAQGDLNNAAVKAPFAGYVSNLPVGVGQLVGPQTKIATLVQMDALQARLQTPEAEQSQLRVGLKVVMRVAAYPDRDFVGTVTGIDPAIDATARSITVLALAPNPGAVLRPGMFASARIELPESNKIIYVPAEAVLTQAGSSSSSVFVVDGESVTQKLVRLGARDGKSVGILTGLEPGARVAIGNVSQLFDGASVTIRNRS
jgi:multidrug efflux pump subunit AcrA (membrane-fusion protein)